MIKVHVHVLGYGRAAREVCEQALRGEGCFGHLMRGSTEFSGRFFFQQWVKKRCAELVIS